jgi:8-oxo-dGTP pyrophosphatase MutT (NUDIX family)
MMHLSVIVFRDTEGKILLQFRDSKAPNEPLGWSFFGGVAEGEEAPVDALLREVEEELGLTLASEDIRLLAEREWTSPNSGLEKIVYFYEATQPLAWGDFKVFEGAGAAFCTKEEIAKMQGVSLLAKTFVADYC